MKIQYINNLRAFACILVLLTHAALPAVDDSFGLYMVMFSLIASPSSELFVTISSSLLAPTKQEMFAFYRKRFAKLIPPFLFWSIVILIINLFKTNFDFSVFFRKLLLFPLVPVTGVYWFVYAIAGLYLIIPLVSPWLNGASKKQLLFVILIWLITLLLPFLNIALGENLYKTDGDYYFILVYLGGFVGYLFLGVFLRKYPIIFKKKLKAALFVTTLLLVGTIPIAYAYIIDRSSLPNISHNLSLTSAIFVMAIFCFFQNFKLPKFLESFFNTIAKYSYGIYLIHIIVIRDVIWIPFEKYRLPHPIIETPVITIIGLLTCLFIVWLISLLPKSKYIVGA